MRQALLWPLLCATVISCASPGERRARAYARDFVQWDARSDAANIAASLCGGDAELISGRTGLAPDDYQCVGRASRAETVPSTYICVMEDDSEIAISVLTEMSGEVRDGANRLQLKYPVFQSNDTLVLVRASPPTQPYLYSLFIDDMRLVRAHVAVNPDPSLEGKCRRK